MKLSLLKTLSAPEIERIHEASVNILGRCGGKVLDKSMLSLLQERGLAVDRGAGRRVRCVQTVAARLRPGMPDG